MLSVSWETLLNLAVGALGAGWAGMAMFCKHLLGRISNLEQQHVGRTEFTRVARDVDIIKRLMILMAHEMGINAEALNR